MINVAYFSNFLNSHSLPLCWAFSAMENVNFKFVSMSPISALGRENLDDSYDFVIKAYCVENTGIIKKILTNYEVVIFGDMDDSEAFVKCRATTGKIFFRTMERILKRGMQWRYFPPKMYRTYDRYLRYRDSQMYVLCAGAFTSLDLSLCGFPASRCYKWGYYPLIESNKPCRSAHKKDAPFRLFSAQRLLDWKRVDLQLSSVKHLDSQGIGINLEIAGIGPEERKLRSYASKLDLRCSSIKFLGGISPVQVQNKLLQSDIALVTSNRKEGWGAVINEAMGAGCVVIASSLAGAAPYLIEDESTGYIFKSGSVESLVETIGKAIQGICRGACVGDRARYQIGTIWNENVAADRLVNLYFELDGAKGTPYVEGPCSVADVIKEDWYESK